MKYFACFLLLSVSSCQTIKEPKAVVCRATYKAVYAASASVAKVLKCSNGAAVAADFGQTFEKTGLCDATIQGPVGNLVCPIAAQTVVDMGVGSLPAAWGCTGGVPAAALQGAITKACVAGFPL